MAQDEQRRCDGNGPHWRHRDQERSDRIADRMRYAVECFEDHDRSSDQQNESNRESRPFEHSHRWRVYSFTQRCVTMRSMIEPSAGRQLVISTVDYHTAGEPFRIVSGGVPPLRGRTIMDKRRDALQHLEHIRQLLVFEPRGHADMYGGLSPNRKMARRSSASSSFTTRGTAPPVAMERSRW